MRPWAFSLANVSQTGCGRRWKPRNASGCRQKPVLSHRRTRKGQPSRTDNVQTITALLHLNMVGKAVALPTRMSPWQRPRGEPRLLTLLDYKKAAPPG